MEKPAILSRHEVWVWVNRQQGGKVFSEYIPTPLENREAQRDDTYQKMLDAFQEQIKKIENPYDKYKPELASAFWYEQKGYEECRQAVLKEMK